MLSLALCLFLFPIGNMKENTVFASVDVCLNTSSSPACAAFEASSQNDDEREFFEVH
jgi:hypothetical protein